MWYSNLLSLHSCTKNCLLKDCKISSVASSSSSSCGTFTEKSACNGSPACPSSCLFLVCPAKMLLVHLSVLTLSHSLPKLILLLFSFYFFNLSIKFGFIIVLCRMTWHKYFQGFFFKFPFIFFSLISDNIIHFLSSLLSVDHVLSFCMSIWVITTPTFKEHHSTY